MLYTVYVVKLVKNVLSAVNSLWRLAEDNLRHSHVCLNVAKSGSWIIVGPCGVNCSVALHRVISVWVAELHIFTGARATQSHVKTCITTVGNGGSTVEPAGKFHKCKYWHLGWRRHWNQVSSDWQQHFVYLHSEITPWHHLQNIFSPSSTKVWQWTRDNNVCVWKKSERMWWKDG